MNTADARPDRVIDYIEFNVADIARSKAFYGAAFGWSFADYGPSYCEFSDGRMKGGFDASGAVTPGGPLVILYHSDLAAIQADIEAAGGHIVKPIFTGRDPRVRCVHQDHTHPQIRFRTAQLHEHGQVHCGHLVEGRRQLHQCKSA